MGAKFPLMKFLAVGILNILEEAENQSQRRYLPGASADVSVTPYEVVSDLLGFQLLEE